ncbi:MAG: PepSY domain-containing protein [Ferrimicrobium sp.]
MGIAVVTVVLVLIGTSLATGIPAPAQQPYFLVANPLERFKVLYPGSQVLSIVPDSYHSQSALRYDIRTHTGRLWNIYVSPATGRVLGSHARIPQTTSTTVQSVKSSLQIRQSAIQIARNAIGGGLVGAIRTESEDNGRVYVVKIMLPNGQYATVKVDTVTATALSVQTNTTDQ